MRGRERRRGRQDLTADGNTGGESTQGSRAPRPRPRTKSGTRPRTLPSAAASCTPPPPPLLHARQPVRPPAPRDAQGTCIFPQYFLIFPAVLTAIASLPLHPWQPHSLTHEHTDAKQTSVVAPQETLAKKTRQHQRPSFPSADHRQESGVAARQGDPVLRLVTQLGSFEDWVNIIFLNFHS